MAKLTVVANITAKDDKIDQVKAELEKLIDITCAEEGLLRPAVDKMEPVQEPATLAGRLRRGWGEWLNRSFPYLIGS